MGDNEISKSLGIASVYNMFILGNAKNLEGPHINGRVAIGGDATINEACIGESLSSSKARADLIVGGKMTITNGSNKNGNSIIYNKDNLIKYTMSNCNSSSYQLVEKTIVNFKSAGRFLKSTSRFLATLDCNTEILIEDNSLKLIGTDDYFNIFYVDGYCLESAKSIDIIASNSAKILINVCGEKIKMEKTDEKDMLITRNSREPSIEEIKSMIWNFSELLDLEIISRGCNDFNIPGSFLAPWASANMVKHPNIKGNLIFKDISGQIDSYDYSNYYEYGKAVDSYLFDKKLPKFNACVFE